MYFIMTQFNTENAFVPDSDRGSIRNHRIGTYILMPQYYIGKRKNSNFQ